MTRPAFTPPAGIPAALAARMAEHAAACWACVLADGRAFFIDTEDRARRMAAAHAGAVVFAPV